MNYGGACVPYVSDVRIHQAYVYSLVTYLCSYERSMGRPRRSDRLLPLVWCERLSRLPTEIWSSFENPALNEPKSAPCSMRFRPKVPTCISRGHTGLAQSPGADVSGACNVR